MITTLPFSGFYCSRHDDALDMAVENMFVDRATGCDRNPQLEAIVFNQCEWPRVHLRYAQAYVEQFAKRLELTTLKFESISSPKEYNFSTDRIFCHIDIEEVRRLRQKVVSEKAFRDKVREKFTSCDGFISSYPNDPDEWPPLEEWDHNHVGTLLSALADQETDGFDEEEQAGLMEDCCGNGEFDNWISEATPGIGRLYTIHDYLQDRTERV